MYSNIRTPNYVKKYATIWTKNQYAKESLDVVRRVMSRLQGNPQIAVFTPREDEAVGDITWPAQWDPDSFVESKKEHVLHVMEITKHGVKKFKTNTLFRYPDSSVHFVIPSVWLTRLTVGIHIPVYIFLGWNKSRDTTILAMPENIRAKVAELIRSGTVRDILFECTEAERRGAHATVLLYSVTRNMIYYINPWGSSTPKDREVSFAQWRLFFQENFQVTIKGVYNTWDICPYPIQGVEHLKQAKGISGLCRLWSLMLMTKYLEQPFKSPRRLVGNLFHPNIPSKHPFRVMDEWLRSLGLPLTPKHRPQPSSPPRKPSQPSPPKKPKVCKETEVLNPLTNRCISKTGKVYHDLVRQGKLQPNPNPNPNPAPGPKKGPKPCKEGTVSNPLTKRCISKTGKVYRDLVKQGVLP